MIIVQESIYHKTCILFRDFLLLRVKNLVKKREEISSILFIPKLDGKFSTWNVYLHSTYKILNMFWCSSWSKWTSQAINFRPPEDLWSFFDDFSSSHVAAMAPCLYHYDTPRNKVPYYGETGLNAGIMHMDLARMRDIPDGWTRANMAMHDKYRNKIKLADQVDNPNSRLASILVVRTFWTFCSTTTQTSCTSCRVSGTTGSGSAVR